eukprot:TRINITY_DN2152_c0_g2_i1.p1 TRINITY_DN2152_c0_g2~~TRINITY_DN2152_c0_g2_i1.p1  ORF type:complete len:838 (+),score=323.43 TRINITY_DN2152_c0_g2_i1:102-2615(+)
MAEARSACHPVPGIGLHQFRVDPTLHQVQVAVTGDGVVCYVPHPRFLWRNFVRFIYESRNMAQTLIWPMPGRVYTALVLAFVAWVQLAPEAHWLRSGMIAEAVWWIDSCVPLTRFLPVTVRVGYLALIWGMVVTLCICMTQRAFLRVLLSYHGWMVGGRHPTMTTKIWGALLKYLYIKRGFLAGKPLLYAFQGALPSLPLPKVEATLQGWLNTVQPLLTPEQFEEKKKAVADFLGEKGNGVAYQLQKYLWLRSLVARNYVSDWWMRFVYLRGRGSIFINSNFYIMDNAAEDPKQIGTTNQLARAAVLIYHLLMARRFIDHERLPPLMIQEMVPLCMDQYSRAFNCTRIPGKDEDVMRTWPMDEAKHIVINYKGTYYSLYPYSKDQHKVLSPREIMELLQGIVQSHSVPPGDPSAQIAALTTMGRTEWATLREEHFLHNRHNRGVLDQVERAMFHVVLDDREPPDWNAEARALFMGTGSNIWCDKSFTCVIFKNGRAGLHTEHTWADAPVIAHIWEWVLAQEQAQLHALYTEDGLGDSLSPAKKTKWDTTQGGLWREKEQKAESASNSPKLLRPTQLLPWRVPPELVEHIRKGTADAAAAMDDLELAVGKFDDYGKGLVKKCGVSPDAWVQMALQLAYFRNQGHFDLTYESSMTRLFKYGRTETIRACSTESCRWVRAMEDKQTAGPEKLKMLKEAGARHQRVTRECMIGAGIDRHLFGLYVVSVGKGIDAPFLKDALSMPFRLSTSQVPQRQTPKGTWPGGDMGDKYYCPGGCFGPVADDGYGVCYGIVGETRFLFHVSSKVHAQNTSSKVFLDAIWQALRDMGALLEFAEKKGEKK